jgi:hypothetical protein
MPHMDHNQTKLVRKSVNDVEALPTNLLLKGKTPGNNGLLGIKALVRDSPKTKCKCSAKTIFRSLRLLTREEVDNILREEGQIEALCQNCGTVYIMGREEVEKRFLGTNGYHLNKKEVYNGTRRQPTAWGPRGHTFLCSTTLRHGLRGCLRNFGSAENCLPTLSHAQNSHQLSVILSR